MRYSFTLEQISKKDKLLFPESGITKFDIAEYYDAVAQYMLPFLKDRPITMQRFPAGITAKGFFQKNASDHFPDWIERVKVKKKDGWLTQIICNSKEALIYLADQYVITFHITLSRKDAINFPDKLVFDLDPPQGGFELVKKGAIALRSLLENDLAFKTYIMTSGSKGLHLIVPLQQKEEFIEVHEFAMNCANYLAYINPEEFTTEIRKKERKGRLYIDSLRNSYMQTSVAPYSVRATENASVATLLDWSELNTIGLHAQSFTIKNILKRLEKVENPWKDLESNAMSIAGAKKKLAVLIKNANLTDKSQ